MNRQLSAIAVLVTATALFLPTRTQTFARVAVEGHAASSDSAQRAAGTDAEAHHALIAAIAANLKQRYVDRAIGQQLADALLKHDKNGDYASVDTGENLAARINRDIQATCRVLGIPRGVFVVDVVYSARPLPTGPPPPMTPEMRERNRAALLQQNCLFERPWLQTDCLPSSIVVH